MLGILVTPSCFWVKSTDSYTAGQCHCAVREAKVCISEAQIFVTGGGGCSCCAAIPESEPLYACLSTSEILRASANPEDVCYSIH